MRGRAPAAAAAAGATCPYEPLLRTLHCGPTANGPERAPLLPQIIIGVGIAVVAIVGAIIFVVTQEDTVVTVTETVTETNTVTVGAPPAACAGHGCVNGECAAAAGNTYTCTCSNLVRACEPNCGEGDSTATSEFAGGATWQGAMCDTLPDCGVCGAANYCGPNPGCDPAIPPEPAVAVIGFDVSAEQALELIDSPTFDVQFSRDMERALEIAQGSIVVLNKVGGSLLVTFAILPNAQFNSTGSGGYAYSPADKLTALTEMQADPASDLYTDPQLRLFGNMPPSQTIAITTVVSPGVDRECPGVRSDASLPPPLAAELTARRAGPQ